MPEGSKQAESKVQKDQKNKKLSEYSKDSSTESRLVEEMRRELMYCVKTKGGTFAWDESFLLECQAATKGMISKDLVSARDKFGFTNNEIRSDKTWRMARDLYRDMIQKGAIAVFKDLQHPPAADQKFFKDAGTKDVLEAKDFGAWAYKVLLSENIEQEVKDKLPQ